MIPSFTHKTKKGRIFAIPGITILIFPDTSQCVINGLEEILAAMYNKGKPANLNTARKILKKVNVNHSIGYSFRQQYCHLLPEEYRKYYHTHVSAEQADGTGQYIYDEKLNLTVILWKLLYTVLPSAHPWSLSTGQN